MKLEDLLVEDGTKDQNGVSVAALLDHHRRHPQLLQQPSSKLKEHKSEEEKNDLIKKKQKRTLQKEVMKMQGELEDEQALNKALRDMHRGPVMSQPRLSLLLLPPQVQELIEELATVEAEILCLEKRIQDLKLDVYSEKKENEVLKASIDEGEEEKMMNPKKLLQRQNHLPCDADNDIIKMRSEDLKHRSKSHSYEDHRAVKDIQMNSPRTYASIGSAREFSSRIHSSTFSDGTSRTQEKNNVQETTANVVSEDLVKCLMGIYLELNRSSREREGSKTVSKLSLTHLKNASFKRKSVYDHNASNLDPYGAVMGASLRDIGEYKNFIHITRTSIDVSRLSDCSTSLVNLRVLKEKLSRVDLSFLNHKKKMAFWINTYNACVMNGFLEHGLPSSKEKLLTLLKMATIDVGGMQLSALDIEDSILQSPCEPRESVPTGESEARIQKRYGFRCVEPNLMFVLCRGDWSSPALRVYTAEDVVNELIKARTEYLEASIGISGRKKIMIPSFLQKRLRDFAEDEGSLVEWICSQLPPVQRCLQLKETAMEWLNKKGTEAQLKKLVEVRAHEYEFRYLFPL
ncbi:PREDICTED: uncharacterized protein LOC104765019 [Camelina sativa]|uniref:Uncharacterized protein LOC104765019 n=1 Tax=Camelina sativa TaxID=90675 RepID=A0ABM0XJP0_CAMSA|nr:PREDICTED: uncharacterized protein LOC104765019 [Camelina sativa]